MIYNLSINAMAVGDDPQVEAVAVRATGRFNMDVPAGTIIKSQQQLSSGGRRNGYD